MSNYQIDTSKEDDLVNLISAYEGGIQSEEDTIAMFQRLINDGTVWQLQGSYGRLAMDLLAAGLCELGEKGYRDYWGNYVPSRYEVTPGTKGAPLPTRRMQS